MAKQKRKGSKLTEKKSKKLKKVSVEENPDTPEPIADTKEAGPKLKHSLQDLEQFAALARCLQGPEYKRNPAQGEAAGRVQEEGPELSPEERRVIERKLKKERKKEEKKRLREAGTAAAQTSTSKPSGAALALDYLCGWAHRKENWKFQKTRQTWLLLHMYDSDQVPDEHFSTLLAYLEGLKGQARALTVQKAEALMQELDEAGAEAAVQGKAQRLRQVLQLLS